MAVSGKYKPQRSYGRTTETTPRRRIRLPVQRGRADALIQTGLPEPQTTRLTAYVYYAMRGKRNKHKVTQKLVGDKTLNTTLYIYTHISIDFSRSEFAKFKA